MSEFPPSAAMGFNGIPWNDISRLELDKEEAHEIEDIVSEPIEMNVRDNNIASKNMGVLVKILTKIVGENYNSNEKIVLHCVITKLYDIITYLKTQKQNKDVTIASVFFAKEGLSLVNNWITPLEIIIIKKDASDEYSQTGASLVLALSLLASPDSLYNAHLEDLTKWIISQLRKRVKSVQEKRLRIVLPTLTALMYCPKARKLFSESEPDGLNNLTRQMDITRKIVTDKLRTEKDRMTAIHQLHKLTNCISLMTSDLDTSPIARANFAKNKSHTTVLALNVKSLISANKVTPHFAEKVASLTISALVNLTICPKDPQDPTIDEQRFVTYMFKSGLLKYILNKSPEYEFDNMAIKNDIKFLTVVLTDYYNNSLTLEEKIKAKNLVPKSMRIREELAGYSRQKVKKVGTNYTLFHKIFSSKRVDSLQHAYTRMQ